MIRGFLRFLVAPIGRTLIALLLTAAAWAAWLILPERPIRSLRFENISFSIPKPANGGRSIVVSIHPTSADESDEPNERASRLDDVVRLIDLKSGRDLIPAKRAVFSEIFNNEQYLALYRPNCHIDVYDTRDGTLVSSFKPDQVRPAAHIRGAARGPFLIVGGFQPDVTELWDARQGIKLRDVDSRSFLDWSSDGHYMAFENSRRLSIIETQTGDECGGLDADFVFDQRRAFVLPNDAKLVFVIPAKFSRDQELVKPMRVVVVSIPDCRMERDFEIESATSLIEMTPRGRFLLGTRGGMRNLGDCINVIAGPTTKVVSAPDDSSFVKTDGANSPAWQILRSDDMSEIAQGMGGMHSSYSPGSRWVAIATQRPARPPNLFDRVCMSLFRWIPARNDSDFVSIYDAKSGQSVHDIPNVTALRFGDDDSLWTFGYDNTRTRNMIVAQWPIRAPWPTWWVWVFTGISIVAVINCVRHARDASSKRR